MKIWDNIGIICKVGTGDDRDLEGLVVLRRLQANTAIRRYPKTHKPIDSIGLKSDAWYELLTSGPLATWVNPFLRAISP
jgi:hypothetical protein